MLEVAALVTFSETVASLPTVVEGVVVEAATEYLLAGAAGATVTVTAAPASGLLSLTI